MDVSAIHPSVGEVLSSVKSTSSAEVHGRNHFLEIAMTPQHVVERNLACEVSGGAAMTRRRRLQLEEHRVHQPQSPNFFPNRNPVPKQGNKINGHCHLT